MHEATFEPTPASAKLARDFVSRCSAGQEGLDYGVLSLLVSELATNAIVHSGLPFVVGVELSASYVRVTVEDRSTAPAVAGQAADGDTDGRGLAIVESLSDKWGAVDTPGGKRVWFDLSW